MLLSADRAYGDEYAGFSWELPADFNIGRAVSDDWAEREPERVCLEHFSPEGDHQRLTDRGYAIRSNAFGHALVALGVGRGDQVALMLPQGFSTAIAHAAAAREYPRERAAAEAFGKA